VSVRDGVVNNEGNWVEAWKVQPMFPEYTNDDGEVVTEEQQIDAYEAAQAAERRSNMTCTPRQARLALASAGLYEAVQTSVAAVSDQARIEWEYATMIERTNPIIIGMQMELGISDEALDGLFALAVTL